MVIQKAAKADWKSIDEKLKRKTEWDVKHFPQQVLPDAKKTHTDYFSPGVILQRSIRAPVDTYSGYHWEVLYPKGTHVNPLRRGLEPVTRMLFFNEDKPRQVAFMKAVLRAYPYFVMPVALGGNIPKQARAIGRPMYYAYPTILQRFQIHAVPALLGVGSGKYRYDMAVTYFGPDALRHVRDAPEEVHAAWFGLMGKGEVRILPRAPNKLSGKPSIWSVHKRGRVLTGGRADIYAQKALEKYNRAHGTDYSP
ncbi:hypothetical protein ACJU26_08985 [Acidithiobacillus sp. M4-SHS-6]|uniref:hypothetical protein n=1 Tax=Acidithiobacillus sp. M4-SHS-6 TaxID=3383024 RepID=UPI0039BEB351